MLYFSVLQRQKAIPEAAAAASVHPDFLTKSSLPASPQGKGSPGMELQGCSQPRYPQHGPIRREALQPLHQDFVQGRRPGGDAESTVGVGIEWGSSPGSPFPALTSPSVSNGHTPPGAPGAAVGSLGGSRRGLGQEQTPSCLC